MPSVNVTLLLSILLMENLRHTRTLIQPNVSHTLMVVMENVARALMGTTPGSIPYITNAATAPLYQLDHAKLFFTIDIVTFFEPTSLCIILIAVLY